MPHLVVSISGHGYGHLAQTAPVLNALFEHAAQPLAPLRLTVRSAVPLALLRSRIRAPFDFQPGEGDIGMVMSSALDVLADESRAFYRAFHQDWDRRVAGEAGLLRELEADFVFSNVGYLSLAGAQRAGIPNAALCSLNWADIYRHYFGEDDIYAKIYGCYANADAFLRATPGMAMSSLPNLIPVPPIAEVGTSRRGKLNRRLGITEKEKLVLVSMGGISGRLPIERWPRLEGVRLLVQENWKIVHPDAVVLETLQMSFSDLLASSDALICKPGYGSFVEAACCGVPVLYVSRADWPESPDLIAWLQRHNLCSEVSRDALWQGEIADTLKAIWNAPRPNAIKPEGAKRTAEWILERLQC